MFSMMKFVFSTHLSKIGRYERSQAFIATLIYSLPSLPQFKYTPSPQPNPARKFLTLSPSMYFQLITALNPLPSNTIPSVAREIVLRCTLTFLHRSLTIKGAMQRYSLGMFFIFHEITGTSWDPSILARIATNKEIQLLR